MRRSNGTVDPAVIPSRDAFGHVIGEDHNSSGLVNVRAMKSYVKGFLAALAAEHDDDSRLRVVDCFLLFCATTAAIVTAYFIFLQDTPFYSALAGMIAPIGCLVFTGASKIAATYVRHAPAARRAGDAVPTAMRRRRSYS